MKRPITILCVSDLHLLVHGDDKVLKPLEQFRKNLSYFRVPLEQIEWTPDFLLIAGDLVDSPTPANYEEIKKQIDTLIEHFNIEPFRVILTPGNHDKQILSESELKELKTKKRKRKYVIEYKRTKGDFEDICKVEKRFNNLNLKERFVEAHAKTFRQFSKLYEYYVNTPSINSQKFLYWDLFEGFPTSMKDLDTKSIEYTSGLKVFEDEKVCFVSVNTEWLYTIEDIIPDYEQNRLLCTPFVGWAFKEIRKSYPDYTVVTLMHRGPHELSWGTQNHSDFSQIDALSLIEKYSDIILSGHNHTCRITPPTMLQNHAQHFELGSLSRPPINSNENVRYTATLININPIRGKIRILAYDHWNEYHPFKFVDLGSFPLPPKYVSQIDESNLKSNLSHVIIRAKSSQKTDIERALKQYLQWDKMHNHSGLLLFSYNELNYGINLKEHKIKETLNQHDRVFLYRWQLVPNLPIKYMMSKESNWEKLKKTFQLDILSMKLIMADILVDIPIIALSDGQLGS